MKGFTLLELILVLALIGILSAAAAPVWKSIFANAAEKEAARTIASALRAARSKAISENREYQLQFDCSVGKVSLRRGNHTTKSTEWSLVKKYKIAAVTIKGTLNCNRDDFSIQFNPNGTANSSYACIQNKQGQRKYAAGVSSATTGRVVIRRWDLANSTWD